MEISPKYANAILIAATNDNLQVWGVIMAVPKYRSAAVSTDLRIQDLISAECICAHYQPIVSLKKQTIIGFDVTCHGVHPVTNVNIPLRTLYRAADKEGVFVKFDRHCRDVALTALSALHRINPNLLLFLRFESAVLNHGVVGSNYLLEQVRGLQITPANVVIEVVESSVRDGHTLERFVRAYKRENFLIDLCGLGTTHLHLQRIPLVHPNIVHLEGVLITDLIRKRINQIIVRSFVKLAHNMGALVVANGINSIEAGVIAMELGIDMQQGELFGDARGLNRHDLLACRLRAREIARTAKTQLCQRVNAARERRQGWEWLTRSLAAQLAGQPAEQFSATMEEFLNLHRRIECLYILNAWGVQVGDTVCGPSMQRAGNCTIFQAAKNNADHSLKEYFYRRQDTDGDLYISEPYVSMASGKTCITLSLSFADANQFTHILCVDMIWT